MTYPANYSFPVYAGDTIAFDVTYKEGTPGSEVGKSLTGATLLCEVATERGGSAVTTMTVTADGDQTTNPGEMTATLPAANSALLTGLIYYYDIQITWADATVQTILQGTLTVTQDVSVT